MRERLVFEVADDELDLGVLAVLEIVQHCVNGPPWSYDHGRIQMGERGAALRVIEDFVRNVKRRRSVFRAASA